MFLQPCFADMDWANLVLSASTSDQDLAKRILRNELDSLFYDAQIRVGDFLRTHPEQELKIVASLNQLRMEQRYLTDGTVAYEYELPLLPGIISTILPAARPVLLVVPMVCPLCGQEWPADILPPEGITLMPKENIESNFSGIIIDCRGLALTPCLFPRILSDAQNEVFSSDFADPHYIIQRGLTAYYSDKKQARERVGDKPLVINALAVTGDNSTNIVISTRDTRLIHGSQHNLDLLKECGVAIIFGQ
jgi:hypothetical protein